MLRDLCRRKASVDENYEWDAVDFCPRPAVDDGKSCIFFSLFAFFPSHLLTAHSLVQIQLNGTDQIHLSAENH